MKKSACSELLLELNSRFKLGFFKESEKYSRTEKEGIFVSNQDFADNGSPLVAETGEIHPDFEVLLDKYQAKVIPIDNANFLIQIPPTRGTKPKEKSFGPGLLFKKLANFKVV